MLLRGKRIIVTGGVTGIGKASVLAMAREGAAVVSMSRTSPADERAVKIVQEAGKSGGAPVLHMQLDVSNAADVKSVFENAVDFLGGLDALVNSAGTQQQKPAEDLDADDLNEQFSIHVLGTAFTSSAAFRYMKDKGGSIINYGSSAGILGMPMMAAYSAAKGAVTAYTRVIAQEWGKYGIRANIIVPSVKTDMYERWVKEQSPERRAEMKAWAKASIPLGGDHGQPADAANLNVFLASDLSSFITGQLIGVDGGLVMGR